MAFENGSRQEKNLLYADDILLLLGDTDTSLRTVMSLISEFGRFLGLTINWSKSALLPLDQIDAPLVLPSCPVSIVT